MPIPISLVGGIAVAILIIAIFLLSYVKAPPDHAFLISGVKKQPRVLIGRAGFRIPFLERMDRLYLGQMSVDIKTGRQAGVWRRAHHRGGCILRQGPQGA